MSEVDLATWSVRVGVSLTFLLLYVYRSPERNKLTRFVMMVFSITATRVDPLKGRRTILGVALFVAIVTLVIIIGAYFGIFTG